MWHKSEISFNSNTKIWEVFVINEDTNEVKLVDLFNTFEQAKTKSELIQHVINRISTKKIA